MIVRFAFSIAFFFSLSASGVMSSDEVKNHRGFFDEHGDVNLGVKDHFNGMNRDFQSVAFRVIDFTGDINSSSVSEFKSKLNRALKDRPSNPYDVLVASLDSKGGAAKAALELALVLEDYGVTTIVGDGATCKSACAILFMSGTHVAKGGEKRISRMMSSSAVIGFHAPFLPESIIEDDQGFYKMKKSEFLVEYNNNMRLVGRLIQQSSLAPKRWPTNLVGHMFDKGIKDFYLIDTIGKAKRNSIHLVMPHLPTFIPFSALNIETVANACIFQKRLDSVLNDETISKMTADGSDLSQFTLPLDALYDQDLNDNILSIFTLGPLGRQDLNCAFAIEKFDRQAGNVNILTMEATNVRMTYNGKINDFTGRELFRDLSPWHLLSFDYPLKEIDKLKEGCFKDSYSAILDGVRNISSLDETTVACLIATQ